MRALQPVRKAGDQIHLMVMVIMMVIMMMMVMVMWRSKIAELIGATNTSKELTTALTSRYCL